MIKDGKYLPGHSKDCWQIPSHFACAHQLIERLQAIVDKLPGWADQIEEANQVLRTVCAGEANQQLSNIARAICEAGEAAREG